MTTQSDHQVTALRAFSSRDAYLSRASDKVEGFTPILPPFVELYGPRFLAVATLALFVSIAVFMLVGPLYLSSAVLVFRSSGFDFAYVVVWSMALVMISGGVMLPAIGAFALIVGVIFTFVRNPWITLILSVAAGLAIGAIALVDMSYTNPGKLGLHRAWWSAALVVFCLPISAGITWWILRCCWREGVLAQ